MKNILKAFFLALTVAVAGSCKVTYSFTGTNIADDVNTITINYFEYKAMKVNPSLSNDFTDAVKDKFRKLTKLEQVDMDGDLELSGEITGYDVKATSVTADEVAAQNRLTVTVKITFTNKKHPEEDVEQSFSNYADYDSTNSLDSVEGTLCEEIIEKIVEDIFNATVATW